MLSSENAKLTSLPCFKNDFVMDAFLKSIDQFVLQEVAFLNAHSVKVLCVKMISLSTRQVAKYWNLRITNVSLSHCMNAIHHHL